MEGESNSIANSTTLDVATLQFLFGERDQESLSSSWSSAKSFTSFLIGIADSQGLITSINDSASIYITEWANDERSEITIKNILDMRSGLEPICFDFVNQNLIRSSN